jgi:transposase-like protein
MWRVRSKHTVRLGTPMHQLKTASDRVTMAAHLAMKGMSIADISEVMGHSAETVTRWLEQSGIHSEKLRTRIQRSGGAAYSVVNLHN